MRIRLEDAHGRDAFFEVEPLASHYVTYKGRLFALQPRFGQGPDTYKEILAWPLSEAERVESQEEKAA